MVGQISAHGKLLAVGSCLYVNDSIITSSASSKSAQEQQLFWVPFFLCDFA